MDKFWMRRLLFMLLLISLVGPNFNVLVQASQLSNPTESVSIQQQTKGYQPRLPNGFQLLSSTPSNLILDIQVPSFSFQTVRREGKSCQTLKADGYFQIASPGEPGCFQLVFYLVSHSI